MKRITAYFLILVLALTGCGAREETPAEKQVFAMDTIMLLTAYGEQGQEALDAGEQAILDMEAKLSRTEEDSLVSALNRADGRAVQVDSDVQDLIAASAHWTEETDGAFDITIAPVADAWGFTGESQHVPEAAVLEEARTHVGMEHVHMDADAGTVTLDPGTKLDLGGVAKGRASDVMAEIFQKYNIPQAMVSLGGNVLVWGSRPDGKPWRVGIQDPASPDDPQAFVGIVELKDAFAITSGGYQRHFEENGTQYHHILDPKTGCPADSGLVSVTVVADKRDGNGTMCDALSTALFVMGEDAALDFWRAHRDVLDLVLVTEDDRVLVTDGLTFDPAEESGYTYETVS